MQKDAHPAAKLFPVLEGEQFEALVADIREHGLIEPIVLHEDQVLDGRNRLRACEKAGIEPRFETWEQDGSPQAYVVSKNLHRRHLNETQRAAIAAKIANMKSGRRTDVQPSRNSDEVSAEEAADLLQVHRATVFHAKAVYRDGTPQEIDAMEQGTASVSSLSKKARARRPAASPKKRILRHSGKNPERIQRTRANAEIWNNLKTALIGLTSLPHPEDVSRTIGGHVKVPFVDEHLEPGLRWLKEFEHVWQGRENADS